MWAYQIYYKRYFHDITHLGLQYNFIIKVRALYSSHEVSVFLCRRGSSANLLVTNNCSGMLKEYIHPITCSNCLRLIIHVSNTDIVTGVLCCSNSFEKKISRHVTKTLTEICLTCVYRLLSE